MAQELTELQLLLALHVRAEAEPRLAQAPLHDLIEPDEGAAADEQDVAGVDLQEILLRMFPPTFGRHIGDRAFDDLQKRLLDALTRYVTGDRGVVALPADLVDFVDVDDAALRALDVMIRVL